MMTVSFFSYSQNVAINSTGTAPDPSSVLDLSSSNKGFLAPRVADTNAIATPVEALIIYDLSSHCYRYYTDVAWTACLLGEQAPLVGVVSTLDCAGVDVSGTLEDGVSATGTSFSLDYTVGNGGTYAGESVTSSGVTGLTATLSAGVLASGSGIVVYNIAGIPSGVGVASFSVNLGGQACVVEVEVYAAGMVPLYCAGSPTDVVDVLNPTTGEIWMDRNLGATQVATSSSNIAAYGSLYQWGRFTDGHQCRTSNVVGITVANDSPGHGDFISASSSPNDWRAPQNDNLWQGAAGINNPCPSGYRLPSEAELNAERLSWGSTNSAGAFGSPLKLTVGGYRLESNGLLNNVGIGGYYWSNTINGIFARGLNFDSGVSSIGSGNRAYGFSVRCIKD